MEPITCTLDASDEIRKIEKTLDFLSDAVKNEGLGFVLNQLVIDLAEIRVALLAISRGKSVMEKETCEP